MRNLIRSIGFSAVALAVGGLLTLAAPEPVAAQQCANCAAADECPPGDTGGVACDYLDGPCNEIGTCDCTGDECEITLPKPEGLAGLAGGDLDNTLVARVRVDAAQIPENVRGSLPPGALALHYVEVGGGNFAAWNCSGRLIAVLHEREDGMFIPLDVRDWRGHLATRSVTEDGRVIVTLI